MGGLVGGVATLVLEGALLESTVEFKKKLVCRVAVEDEVVTILVVEFDDTVVEVMKVESS